MSCHKFMKPGPLMGVRTEGCPGSKSLQSGLDRPGGLSYHEWPSEVDLGSELHAARGAIGTDLAERADGDVGAGVAVGFHQIQRVEGFQTNPQLRLPLAQDVEILHQAGIQRS